MPRAVDRRQLTITHDPTRRISEETPKTPPFTGPTQMFPTGDFPIPIVQEIIDSIINGFNAWTGGQAGFTTTDLSEFSRTVAQAIGTLGTFGQRLEQLENGATILEDFSTYPDNTGAIGRNWSQWAIGNGGGTLGISVGYAVVTLAGDTANKIFYAIHPTASSGLVKVSAPISTPASLFGDSESLLVARSDGVRGGDHIFAGMTAGKARIGFVKGGQVTTLKSVNHFFRNGSIYSLDAREERTWRLYENTSLVLEATDTNAQSSYGPGFARVGFAAFCPNGVARPGVLSSFATYEGAP